jgi:DNA-binding NarL/FixJ family response regulator
MKFLLADDHEMVRVALKVALGSLAPGITFVEAGTAEAALAAADANPDLDLALIDVHMPGMGGVEGVRRLRAAHPALPVIACSAAEEGELVKSLLALGVSGFIPKSDSTQVIVGAVQLVLAGGTYVPPRLLAGLSGRPVAPAGRIASLTPRQQDVLRLLAEGKPSKVIARDLDIAEATVKVHLLAVFRALGARNRTEAVVIAQRLLARDEKGGAA